MDRQSWKEEKQRVSEQRTDSEWAPIYDENWGRIDSTHTQFLQRFLDRVVPHGRILDAACGTGKYWPMILANGYLVSGIDRSQGMLDRARAKFPNVPTRKMALQDLDDRAVYAGAICIDALESLFPEDWLPVLQNLHRALVPAGCLYFTVETMAEAEIKEAFADGQRRGLPIMYGEYAPEGRYHYYPSSQQVKDWLDQAGYKVIDETEDKDYIHIIAQKIWKK